MVFGMVYGLMFLPFCHNSRVWQTDRRTNRILIARPRLHSIQRRKNVDFVMFACIRFFGSFTTCDFFTRW